MTELGTDNARKIELADILGIMRQEAGRAVMYRVLQATGLHADVFNLDPCIHAHKAGKRSHGVWLLRELKEAAPDMVNQMFKEHGYG